MFAFDFSGSGRSDGEYVSLGFFEREDLKIVVDFLRASGKVSTIALWGRSMGAATSLLHGDRDPSIAAMILDRLRGGAEHMGFCVLPFDHCLLSFSDQISTPVPLPPQPVRGFDHVGRGDGGQGEGQ